MHDMKLHVMHDQYKYISMLGPDGINLIENACSFLRKILKIEHQMAGRDKMFCRRNASTLTSYCVCNDTCSNQAKKE